MKAVTLALLAGLLLGGSYGCVDNSPPPERIPIPVASNPDAPITRRSDEMKPLPPDRPMADPAAVPPYVDLPLVSQELPEQPAFVDAYRKVGSPRFVVMVVRPADGTLDFDAVEKLMIDWLACNGQVIVMSPAAARQRLTEQQLRDVQDGRAPAMGDVLRQAGADILVQVQAQQGRQTEQGQEARIVAEAWNTQGGESIARAVVDVPAPVDRALPAQTRLATRKLMDGMLMFWSSAPAPAAPPAGQVAPRQPPAPQPPASPPAIEPLPAAPLVPPTTQP